MHTALAATSLPSPTSPGDASAFPLFPVGHFNPIVTIAVAVRQLQEKNGQFSAALLFQWVGCAWVWLYIFMQVLGSMLAAAILSSTINSSGQLGAPAVGDYASLGQAVLAEIVNSFALVLILLSALGRVATSKQEWDAITLRAPVLAAVAVASLTMVASSISGGSFNPARSFGSAALSGAWGFHWIYWAGPIVGGFLGSLVYEVFVARRR